MSSTTLSANTNPSVVDAATSEGDGRIHSLPHNKHGPYTCSKCYKVFSKNQSFAAHVSSHYKHESSEEKMRRLISRKKNKKISVQMMTNKITSASVSIQPEAAVLESTDIRRTNRQAPMVMQQDLDHSQRTTQRILDHIKDDHLGPPPGFEGHHRYGYVKTEQTTLDHIKDDLGPPPGFEGHPRYGDVKTEQTTLHHFNDHLGPPPGFEGHPRHGDSKTDQRTLHHMKDHLGPPPGFEGHPRYGDAKTDQRTLHHLNDHLGPPPGFEGHSYYGDVKIKSEADV